MPMCDEMCNTCGTTKGVCMVYGLCDVCKNPSRGMKLVPIEPTDEMICNTKGSLAFEDDLICDYKSMTAECPIVEVVDVESLKVNESWVNSMSTPNEGYNMALTHLKQNGYKIIKEI